MTKCYLSIVIPTYNEESRIKQTLSTLLNYAQQLDYSYEIIVADDGSEDSTTDLVESVASQHPSIRLVKLEHRGKGWAIKNGILQAEGRYRFIADADLSMPIDNLGRFIPTAIKDFDIAIGSREVPGSHRFREPLARHLMGRTFNWIVRLFAIKGLRDTQCGFKCFQAHAAELLFPLQTANGFGFDVEILFIAQRKGLRINEVPIDWHYHQGSKVKPVRDSILMLKDLATVRLNAILGKYGPKL